ncbi:MAG TPA: hypothetical protein VFX12_08640 [Vicinamibacterales bacterium]|nr:hypothetical protein [Vicinamibacterales bacterium]
MQPHAIPGEVIWSYSAFAAVLVIGVVVMTVRGDWHRARGLDALLLLAPLFYAAPLAGFGVEHFTRTAAIASIVPRWLPWHLFWAYFVGACFIAAALSLVTGIQSRLAAALVGLTFFLFVVLMDVPAWWRHPANPVALTLVLRELAFSGGALALAAGTMGSRRAHPGGSGVATIARYFVALALVWYAVRQFVHPDLLPGVPLARATPGYVYGHTIWAYLAAVVYAVAGVLLLVNRKTRLAAAWAGGIVLLIELAVYVPVAVVDRRSLDNGFNYLGDTLMFAGAVLLLAAAMPLARREDA